MKISVVTPRYDISGVPLAQMRFARALSFKGHDVDILFGYIDPAYEFPVVLGVNVIDFKRKHVRGMLFPLMRYLRSSRPAVVFSAEDHLNAITLLAAILARSKSKISGSSRVIPLDDEAYSNRILSKGWILKQLMRIVMWRANALTCVSKDMVSLCSDVFANAPHVYAYNIVVTGDAFARMHEPLCHEWFLQRDCPVVIAAGALAIPKGFADLINAIGVINRKRRVRLIILGDGPQRRELECLISELGLDELVKLQGFVENPLKYFGSSDVFVLSSYAEGLPNVLVEAMMCGCTPVATDCPTGPREVLKDGKYGYLVPMRNPVAMAMAIEQALDRPIPKNLLAEAVQPFTENAVIKRHFDLLGLADVDGPFRPMPEK